MMRIPHLHGSHGRHQAITGQFHQVAAGGIPKVKQRVGVKRFHLKDSLFTNGNSYFVVFGPGG